MTAPAKKPRANASDQKGRGDGSPQERQTAASPERAPVVTLLTDFGARDGFVGIVKGVLLGRCPAARLVDLSHDVPPQDVTSGALVLASAVGYFPERTVHLAVVDPGVGSARRALAIETESFFLVGPDNGLLSLAAATAPVRRIVNLDRSDLFLAKPGRTFHARDVFAPIAGQLAGGAPAESLGSAVDDFERLSLPVPRRIEGSIEGQILHVDRFGNLVSNIQPSDLADFREEDVSVTIRGVEIRGVSAHYSVVREGRPVALWNSWGRLEVAVRNGSAARDFRARTGDRIVLSRDGRR